MRDDIKRHEGAVKQHPFHSWEEISTDTLEAPTPMTLADIAELYGHWMFPITDHAIEMSEDCLTATVCLTYNKCN